MMLGKQLVEKEQALDRKFAGGSIDARSLKKRLAEIGTIEAKIRYEHLNAHLEQRSLLTKHQIQMYDRLRGYQAPQDGGHTHSH